MLLNLFKNILLFIRLAQAIFPTKIKGNYLDTLARMSLWEVGLDYSHGTGHGVGSYLNVHEGPMGISWRPYPDDPGLQVGMVLSNEPGYYQDGEFGETFFLFYSKQICMLQFMDFFYQQPFLKIFF